jgi:hypothetical protein
MNQVRHSPNPAVSLCLLGTLLGAGIAALTGWVPREAQSHYDLAALQGLWVLKTSEWLGQMADQDPTEDEWYRRAVLRERLPEERELPIDLQEERTRLEIKGATLIRHNGLKFNRGGCFGTEPDSEWTIRLDVTREPRTMVWRRVPSAVRSGEWLAYAWRRRLLSGEAWPWGGQPAERILYFSYRVDGDTLSLGVVGCNDPERLPALGTVSEDGDAVVLTFRRVKR